MNKLTEFYNKKIRLPALVGESYRCKSKKDNLLKIINSSIKQRDGGKAVFFINSRVYKKYLDEISSLNYKLSNFKEKQTKLLNCLL